MYIWRKKLVWGICFRKFFYFMKFFFGVGIGLEGIRFWLGYFVGFFR